MPYYLTQAQLDAIETQFLLAPTGQPYADRYDAIYATISDPDTFGNTADANVYAWFGAAAQANRGIGGASDFIRAYTNAQSFIRTGQNLTSEQMQAASDAINTAVWNDLAGSAVDIGGVTYYQLPTTYEIGLHDAQETMNALPFATTAIWSGNPLYIGLGHSDFYLQNIIDDPASTYDLMVMREAMIIAGLSQSIIFDGGLSDLFGLFFGQGIAGSATAVAELGQATSATRTYLETAYGSFFADKIGGLTQYMITRTTVGSDAGEMIAQEYPGQGDNDIIHAGAGDDLILGDNGLDLIDGGAGNDTISFADGSQTFKELDVLLDAYGSAVPFSAQLTIPVGSGTPYQSNFYDVEELVLGAGSDVVDFRAITALQLIDGQGGTATGRTVSVEGYADYLVTSFNSYGNTLRLENYSPNASEVRVKLDPENLTGEDGGFLSAGADHLTLLNFDDVIGTSQREVVTGSGTSNYLFGMGGNDLLIGEGATDFLEGGAGDDELYGGFWLGVYVGAGENPADVYTDDDVRDYLVGGTGFDIYYAGNGDLISDARIDAVEQAAAAGAASGSPYPRFVSDGDGEVFFDGTLLDGGTRVAFEQWSNYQPHPSLQIMVVAQGADPYSTNPLDYVQRELFVGGSAEGGVLLYRVMNAYTYDGSGNRVDEWLLIVELAGTGRAISIAGVDYTPGDGIGDGSLGIVLSQASAELIEANLTEGSTGARGLLNLPAGLLDEVVSYSLAGDDLAYPDLPEHLEGLSDISALGTVGDEPGAARRSDAERMLGANTPQTTEDSTIVLSAAKAPGGGGGGGGNGGGGNGGGDPEPPAPETGSGFMGIGLSNPEAAPDSSGNDNLRGGKDNDTLIATLGDDTLKGAGGDDFLEGGAGADVLDGGSGIDTISYTSSSAGVQVQLFNGAASGGHAQGDVISNVEHAIGSGFSDNLMGDAGDNHLVGHFGNDYFESRGGADTLDGGLGNDAVGFSWMNTGSVDVDLGAQSFGGAAAGTTYISIESFGGTNNAALGDVLIGSDARNDLYGYDGDDTIQGMGGNDLLNGGWGSDLVDGGDGNDNIFGGGGADILTGGAGYNLFSFYSGDTGTTAATWDVITDFDALADFLDLSYIDADSTNGDWFSSPNDTFRWVDTDPFYLGLAGDLRYEHVNGDTHVMGETDGDGAADFVIVLTGLHDLTTLNFFGDTLDPGGPGGPGGTVDPVYGTDGPEWMSGTDQTDLIYALGGNDTVNPGAGGFDTVYAGDGNDQIYVSVTGGIYDPKEIHGEAGNDYVDGGLGNDTVFGGDGNDTIFGDQYHDLLFGGEGNDSLVGDLNLGGGNDTLYGGGGDDTLRAGNYIDYYDGGDGFDHVSLSNHPDFDAAGSVVDLALDTASYNSGGVETIVNIESVSTTSGNDLVYGDDGVNYINGNSGDDTIHGRAGNDTVAGGAGADVFAFSSGDGNDRVEDFEDGLDQFDLSATGLAFGDLVIADSGADATITYGADQITVLAAAGLIEATDFIFA